MKKLLFIYCRQQIEVQKYLELNQLLALIKVQPLKLLSTNLAVVADNACPVLAIAQLSSACYCPVLAIVQWLLLSSACYFPAAELICIL